MSDSGEISLGGVAQTTLASFWYRASEAEKVDGIINDPVAVEILSAITYDFSGIFGEPDITTASRSNYSDGLVRSFLDDYPDATVIILGEGLETQFWRVDNGRCHWYTVDLPETIAVREKYFPAHDRNIHIACSALDPVWTEQIVAEGPVFLSTSGLLMYFKRHEVLWLMRHISEKFPRVELFIDVVSPLVSLATRIGVPLSDQFQLPRMPFGIRLCRAKAFFEKVDRLTVNSVVSIVEADPEHHRELGKLGTSRFVRNNFLQGYVHARIG